MTMNEAGKLGYIKSKLIFEKQLQTRIASYLANPVKCFCCNTILAYKYRKNKFCSHSCAASKNNLGRCRHGVSNFNTIAGTTKIIRYCTSGCGTIVQKKYCSIRCMQAHLWANRKTSFSQSKKFPSDKLAKRYLLETVGSAGCALCASTTWLGKPLLLLLDHIDGDSTNLLKTNFRLICSNCDTTLPTYKNRNKGKGRFIRRQRYKLNKSY